MGIQRKRFFVGLIAFAAWTLWGRLPAFAQTNGFSNPSSGSAIAGIVTISGTAADPQFLRYELSFFQEFNPGGGWVVFAEGNQPVVDGVLALWDTTVGHNINAPIFPDGAYQLRLRVVRQDYNYDEFFATNVIINNAGSPEVPPNASATPLPQFQTSTPTFGSPTPIPTLTPSVTVLPTSLPAAPPSAATPLPTLTLLPGGQSGIIPSLTPFPTSTPLATAASFSVDPNRGGGSVEDARGGVFQQISQLNLGVVGDAFWRGVQLVFIFFGLMAIYLAIRWGWRLGKRLFFEHIWK